MNQGAGQNALKRLLVVYRRVEEALYGNVYLLRADAMEAAETIALGNWQSPFVVSRQLGEHEIVYGSLLYHIQEAARPIFRIGAHQEKLRESLPEDIRGSMVESRSGNQTTYTSPSNEFPSLFLYQQDEIIKDAIMLSASHMRTLLEFLSSKGNRDVPTYDYEGNLAGSVTIHQLFHALSHHRYCVVSSGFVRDIFSREDTPGLPDLFGTKVKVEELLRESIGFLEGITVNDFVGILCGWLERLTIDSKPKDIILAHQNVYAVAEVIKTRIGDASFSPFQNYLFSQYTSDEIRQIEEAKDKSEIWIERRFNSPRFKMGPDLNAKVIEMAIDINGKQENFEFSRPEFFEKLSATSGKDSLIPIEKLRQ